MRQIYLARQPVLVYDFGLLAVRLQGEVSERLKEHAWKACIR